MKREEEKTNGCLKKKGWGIEKGRKEKRRRVSQGVRVYVDNVKDATLLLLSLLKDYQLIVQCLFMEDVVVTESSMSLTSAPSFLLIIVYFQNQPRDAFSQSLRKKIS